MLNKLKKNGIFALVFGIMLMLNLKSVTAAIDTEKLDSSISFNEYIYDGEGILRIYDFDGNEPVYFQSVAMTEQEYNNYIKVRDELNDAQKTLEEYSKKYNDLIYSDTATSEEIEEARSKYEEYKENTYDVKKAEYYNSIKPYDDANWKELNKSADQSSSSVSYDFIITIGFQTVWAKTKINNEEVYNLAVYVLEEDVEKEEIKDESKEEIKDESKEETKDESKEEIKNPDTGIKDMTSTFIFTTVILTLTYFVIRKKSCFSKNYK